MAAVALNSYLATPSGLRTGLVSYWNLNSASADSVSANNGTDTAITYGAANGKIAGGASFNGTTSFINVGTDSSLNLPGAVSFTAWVKVTAATGYYMIVTRGPPTGATYEFRFETTTGVLNFLSGNQSMVSSVAPTKNNWHHVCFTRSSGNAVLIYIDGVQQGSGSVAGTSLPSTATFLGKRSDGNFFSGLISEASFWNRVLTPTEVLEDYAAGAGDTYPFYGASPGTWAFTGSITGVKRYVASLVLLNTGKVLVSGGLNATPSTLATADLYNPATGTWTATGARVNARYGSTDILLPSGKVLAIGGFNSTYLATCELYDPTATTWATTGSTGVTRYLAAAVLLANGKVLVAGGDSPITATTELYTPGTGTWANTTGAMAVTRQACTLTLMADGRALATGGYNGTAYVNTCEIYDPTASTWSSTGAMSSIRAGHSAVLLQSGKILVVGGSSAASTLVLTAEIYDPTAGTWSSAGSISTGHDHACIALLDSGKVLFIGGRNPTGPVNLDAVHIYDPVANSWAVSSPMCMSRGYAGIAKLPSGQVLVACGVYGTDTTTTAELYTP
jgi:hypothetical protein